MTSTLNSIAVIVFLKEFATPSLTGLPSSYESLIVALDVLSNEDDISMSDRLKSRLIKEDQRASEPRKSNLQMAWFFSFGWSEISKRQ